MIYRTSSWDYKPTNITFRGHHLVGVTSQSLSGWWLSPTPLKNMSSSIGTMTFPTGWNNKIDVPVTTNQISIENCHINSEFSSEKW